MRWCERCLADHEGLCLDEDRRIDFSKALGAYFRNADQTELLRRSLLTGSGPLEVSFQEEYLRLS